MDSRIHRSGRIAVGAKNDQSLEILELSAMVCGGRLGCQKWLGPELAEKMPRMRSDELLLRRFGQPRQASQHMVNAGFVSARGWTTNIMASALEGLQALQIAHAQWNNVAI